MALIIDTETTGLPICLKYGLYPDYKQLDKYDSSRMVQIAMILCDSKYEQISKKSYIVKAVNFRINNHHFHKITNEISNEKGIEFDIVANQFYEEIKKVSHIFAHNANFDINVIKSELYRNGHNHIIDELDKKEIVCTMKYTKNMVKAENDYGIKDPSLAELYYWTLSEKMIIYHNALEDTNNLYKIIKKLYDVSRLNFDITLFSEKEDEVMNLLIDFSKMNVTDLRKKCKELKIKNYSKMKKDELLRVIHNSNGI